MNKKCQIDTVKTMSAGIAPLPPLSIEQRLRIFARRTLSIKNKQRIKALLMALFPNMKKSHQPSNLSASLPLVTASDKSSFIQPMTNSENVTKAVSPIGGTVTKNILQAGDLVRVRDRETIESSLDQWRQYKGCAFMAEMWQYCGTVQRVMKRVQRFVDERDTRVHKASGIVLLENVICQGTADYGPCDRSCFYFWRDEWLEKIEDESLQRKEKS